jgi:uncharacterized protein involved in exopolysaccharide biosynthesis/Mrp family chromosome partitioning ATPase
MRGYRTEDSNIAALMPATSLRDVAEIVFRHGRTMLLIVLTSVALTAGYVLLIRDDNYMAEAKLLVRLGQEQAPTPTTIADRSTLIAGQGSYGTSEIEFLRNRDLIAEVVDRVDLSSLTRSMPTSFIGLVKQAFRQLWHELRHAIDSVLVWIGLKTPLTTREETIEEIAHALTVESPQGSNIVTARIVWPQRSVPEMLLRKLLAQYLVHRAALYEGGTAVTFFRERRDGAAAELENAEAALADFERQHQISNPDEQRTALLRRLADATAGANQGRLDLDLVETSLRQFEKTKQAGERELAAFAVAQYGNTLQQTLTGQLATVAANWLGSQTTLTPQDEHVRRLHTELIALSEMAMRQLHATVAQRREQLALREAQRDGIAAELQSLQDSLPHWQELQRDMASKRRAYEFNDNRLNEATGVAALERQRLGNVVVVQQPSEGALPVGIHKNSVLILSMVGGILLALTWLTVCEFFDHRLHGPADVERRLGLRLLAAVPSDNQRLSARGTLDDGTDATLARAAALLARQVSPTGLNALVVTALAEGEGVSTVTAHLGRHLVSLLGLRVLLVDLGAGSPNLSELLAALPAPPARVPADDTDPLPELPQTASGHWAIADVRSGALRSRQATARCLEQLIRRAEKVFDMVLIDAPPWPESVATLLASRACGHVLVVARADRFPVESLRRMCDELTEECVELVGCILNKYKRPLPSWLAGVVR